jgi:hypothetical protein
VEDKDENANAVVLARNNMCVILISRYPNAIGMPTKSGRRTAAKTQT